VLIYDLTYRSNHRSVPRLEGFALSFKEWERIPPHVPRPSAPTSRRWGDALGQPLFGTVKVLRRTADGGTTMPTERLAMEALTVP
jgi:hypothetical protein